MPFQGAYNIDWVYSTSSSAHVANDRGWFKTYTPFPSRVHVAGSETLEVLGIGDVHLEVNAPSLAGALIYDTLVLHDVLHVPEAVANVVAARFVDGFTSCSFNADGGKLENRATGQALLLDLPLVYKLWLVGQPRGYTSLKEHTFSLLSIDWAPNERDRWKAFERGEGGSGIEAAHNGHKRMHSAPWDVPGAANEAAGVKSSKRNGNNKRQRNGHVSNENEAYQNGASNAEVKSEAHTSTAHCQGKRPRYNQAEKAWLKKAYGNEFKFLIAHGLKIHLEEDRQEGKRMVQAMMDDEKADSSIVDDEPALVYPERHTLPLATARSKPSIKASDLYDKVERKWLQDGYSGEKGFLKRFGLSPHNPADRDKGRDMVRALMEAPHPAEKAWLVDLWAPRGSL